MCSRVLVDEEQDSSRETATNWAQIIDLAMTITFVGGVNGGRRKPFPSGCGGMDGGCWY